MAHGGAHGHGACMARSTLHGRIDTRSHDAVDEARGRELRCRGCDALFLCAAPAPYRTICPHCVARGQIVTLTDVAR